VGIDDAPGAGPARVQANNLDSHKAAGAPRQVSMVARALT
jgi:hypothetical protein